MLFFPDSPRVYGPAAAALDILAGAQPERVPAPPETARSALPGFFFPKAGGLISTFCQLEQL